MTAPLKWLRAHWFDDVFWGLRLVVYGFLMGLILGRRFP